MGLREFFLRKSDPGAYVDCRSKAPVIPEQDYARAAVGVVASIVGVSVVVGTVGVGTAFHASKTISPSDICDSSYMGAKILCMAGVGQPNVGQPR